MEYDTSKYKVWTWKNIMILHWIINPGLAINELVLGQRIPKVYLIEKDSNKPLSEKTFIPCPHCGTLHVGTKWSAQNKTAFGNWFGYYCDHCDQIIPCHTNLFSYLILIITYPIWGWFRESLKAKWMNTQRVRFSKEMVLNQKDVNWWRIGLSFGLFMYIFMSVLYPLVMGEGLDKVELLIGIPIWTIAGLGFGFWMKKMTGKARAKQSEMK